MLKGKIMLSDLKCLFVWNKGKTEKLIQLLKDNLFVHSITIEVYTKNIGKNEDIIINEQQRLTFLLLTYLKVYTKNNMFVTKSILPVNYDDAEED